MQTSAIPADHAATIRAVRAAEWVSRIVMLGATSIVIGILWDISWHRTIGRDTFWTPAHLAIQLGGLMGGITAGWLVLRTTFFGTPEEKAGAAKLWGFRAPLGAWVTIWGCLAMLTSAPFDNWWHDLRAGREDHQPAARGARAGHVVGGGRGFAARVAAAE